MSRMVRKHDSDGDGHVQLANLESAFREAGVSEGCIPFAKASLKHLETHHDHDNNGKLHHDELDISVMVAADEEACGSEIETKIENLLKDPYDDKMSRLLRKHDSDGDGHVQLANLESAFRKA